MSQIWPQLHASSCYTSSLMHSRDFCSRVLTGALQYITWFLILQKPLPTETKMAALCFASPILTRSSIGTLTASSWLSSGTGTRATERPLSAANIKGLFWASRPAIFCFSRYFWQEKACFHLGVIRNNASRMLECLFNLPQNLQLRPRSADDGH